MHDVAPALLTEPGLHGLQPVAPAAALKEPAGHAAHAPPDRNRPAAHCEQPVAPAALKEPAAHGEHAT